MRCRAPFARTAPYLAGFGELCTGRRRYSLGQTLRIRPHEPAPPETHFDGWISVEQAKRNCWKTDGQLSRLFPPKCGRVGSPPLLLEAVSRIRVRRDFRSQILEVRFPGTPSMVAKFFDPFYANRGIPLGNPFAIADQAYANEVAAYHKLLPVQGTLVPRFYGSYSCMFPTGLGYDLRPIRLILLEKVNGIPMDAFDEQVVAKSLSQEVRKKIMYMVVDTESRLYKLGIRHLNPDPRNFLLEVPCTSAASKKDLKSLPENPRLSVRLLDFEAVQVAPLGPQSELLRGGFDDPGSDQLDRPVSPILRWHPSRSLCESFQESGWVDWPWQSWLEEMFAASDIYDPITKAAADRFLPEDDVVDLEKRVKLKG